MSNGDKKVNMFLFQQNSEKLQTSLLMACNDDDLITLALKQPLSDRVYGDKQLIKPGFINRELAKLIKVNPLC